MRFNIEYVIYGYVLLCAALLVYNIAYIFRSKRRKAWLAKYALKWKEEIRKNTEAQSSNKHMGAVKKHQKSLRRKLLRIKYLLSFGMALEQLSGEDPEILAQYMKENETLLQYVAHRYEKRDSMDRAYFAYLVSRYWPCGDGEYRPIMDILLSYLDNSTIYCRENILNAFYSLGNCYSVEAALQILSDRNWFHHQKLLSDGLLTFSGDREELAARLWSHQKDWNETIILSVIQFITGFSNRYRKIFLPILQLQETNLEHRLAILRYYRRHIYEPVRPVLYSYLSDEKVEENLAIVAASVLARYPGKDTTRILKQALHHSSWYIRYNAADSLSELGFTQEDLRDILCGDDRYAKEMVHYMLDKRKAGAVHGQSGRLVSPDSGNVLHRIPHLIRNVFVFFRNRGRMEAVSKRTHAANQERT